MDTEIVLIVQPRPEVLESSFHRALEESCSAVVGELEAYPKDLVHGHIVPNPPDFEMEAIRLVQENGLANVVMDQKIRAAVGCVEAQPCKKQGQVEEQDLSPSSNELL